MMSIFRLVSCAAMTAVWSIGIAIAADAPVTIIDVGDSLIIGHNLDPADAFPVTLQMALQARGRVIEVVNTGFISTTGSGLAWLKSPAGKKLLAEPANRAVILELGGNDCTQFYDLAETRKNLNSILAQLAEKHIPVLVVGTTPYDTCSEMQGADYAAAYSQIFPDLAKRYDDLLYPDFKDGVNGHPDLMQEDHDHPNREGEAIIVERILPSVEALLERVR